MKRFTLRILAAAAAALGAASAQAYDSPTVFNVAQVPALVTVKYAACKTDTFTVPAKNVQSTGKATAAAARGGCLITSVSATLQGKPYKVAAFSSSGSVHSEYIIRYIGGDPAYKIYQKQDVGSNQFDVFKDQDDSPDGSLASTVSSRQVMSKDQLPNCQKGNQASIRQLEARIAGAPAGKLTKAQKDHYASIRESLKPVPGQAGTIENCNKKTTTIASWKTEVDKALGTTM